MTLAPAPAPAWTPGVPLYPHPNLPSTSSDRENVRPLFELIPDYSAVDFYSDAAVHVRFCRRCEVLWVALPLPHHTHCWVCDRYTRPSRSKIGQAFAVYEFTHSVLSR